MRRILALLLAVFALSLGACNIPVGRKSRPTKKMQVNRRQLLYCPNKIHILTLTRCLQGCKI